MEPDDELDDDGHVAGWIHPDDRLWRHPSEVLATPAPSGGGQARRRRWRWGHEPKLWSVALLAGVIGALLATGVISATGAFRDTTTVVHPTEQVYLPVATMSTLAANFGTDEAVVRIAQKLRPAIVEVEAEGNRGSSNGSGVVFRNDGYVLTTHHVVEGASTVDVVLSSGRRLRASVVGGDPDTDVAVVKVDSETPMATAPFGSARSLKAGQEAVVLGSPMGSGSMLVSKGTVCALGMRITPRNGGPALLDMIQTDRPIAPSTSGGALVDHAGAVVGITTAIPITDGGLDGSGFAVPVDIARDTAEQLIATGRAVHGWIGVDGEDIDPATADQLQVTGGAVVKRVRNQSPASSAGLEAQDVVVAVDKRPVASMVELVVALRSHRPGDVVTIAYLRDGRPGSAKVKLAERPATA